MHSDAALAPQTAKQRKLVAAGLLPKKLHVILAARAEREARRAGR